MEMDEDRRPPQRVIFDLGRNLNAAHPRLVNLALGFRARPTDWMTPWELTAWESLSDDEAWRFFSIGASCEQPPARKSAWQRLSEVPRGAI